MNKSNIFKGVALANFVVLLTVFLLYRNGSFDNFIYNNNNILTSPNGGTSTKITTDSLSVKFDSLDIIRFSSSKSMRIFKDVKLDKDTTEIDSDTMDLKKKKEQESKKKETKN